MSDQSYVDYDEVLPEEPNGELVHWMEPRPLTVGTTGLAVVAAGAFALGAAAALIAVGAARLMLAEERRLSLPRLPGRRRLD